MAKRKVYKLKVYSDNATTASEMSWLLNKNFPISTSKSDQLTYLMIINGYMTLFTGQSLKSLREHKRVFTELGFSSEIINDV